ncbi:MAG: hypothetical protein ABH883_02610 [Candidatus Omnitrophota bacterium]
MGVKYLHACKGSDKCHTENHICQIVARRDMERIKKLVADSKYFCKNCGRAAHEKENLCNPSKI